MKASPDEAGGEGREKEGKEGRKKKEVGGRGRARQRRVRLVTSLSHSSLLRPQNPPTRPTGPPPQSMSSPTTHPATKKAKTGAPGAGGEEGSSPVMTPKTARAEAAAAAAPAHKGSPTKPEGHAAAAAHPAPPLGLERALGAELHTSGTQEYGGRAATILEKGRILFLARPTVAAEEEGKMADASQIRTFYLALCPVAVDEEVAAEAEAKAEAEQPWAAKARLIIIGKKLLPDIGERFWGFVQSVGDHFGDLFVKPEAGGKQKKRSKAAATATAAPPPAEVRLRVLGEGDYALTRVGKNVGSGHLTYVLAEPQAPTPALAEVGVFASAGRFVISIKNPVTPNRGGAGLSAKEKAHFSPDALAAFNGKTARTAAHGLKWVNFSASPTLLNTRHAELILIWSNPPAESDPGLAESLQAAAAQDHEAHLHLQRAADQGAEEAGGAHKGAEAEEAEVREALEQELHAGAVGLDVMPAVTGELE